MRQLSLAVLLFVLIALVLGCSGSSSPALPGISGDQGDNSFTGLEDPTISESDQNARFGVDTEGGLTPGFDDDEHPLQGQPLQGSRSLWGLYTFIIDTTENSVEIVPLRAADMHLNALRFLEPGGAYGMVQVVGGLVWNTDKTQLDIDLRFTHPFPSHPQFSGFDVKGILITKATFSGLTDPYLLFPGSNEFRLLNADGYTRWWNPSEFEGNNIFSYTDGALGMKDSIHNFTGTFNGYKSFTDELGTNDPVTSQDPAMRGVFTAGMSITRHYTIAVPVFPTSLIFNYAIDASWEPPLVKPPVIPDDFPPEANQPEPWAITVTEKANTLFYDAIGGTQGGQLILDVSVYDWQDATPSPGGTVKRVVGEWPGLFPAVNAAYVSDMGDYAIYELTLTPIAGIFSSTDNVEYMIWAESVDGAGYGGILPVSAVLISGARFSATVASEEPNVAPIITQDVTGNASPGLVMESYSVAADDPNGDPITYSWTCDPNISNDPGNGDGTIDIDWTTFGFGTYSLECNVTDSINPPVSAVPLAVSVGNIPPIVGPTQGPNNVSAADTASKYTVVASDPDTGQTLSYTWSFEPDGNPPDYTIPGDAGDGSLTIDWSGVDPALYEISCEVSDGFANVPSAPLVVTHNNTPPIVGLVAGKAMVSQADTNEHYQATWSDPDTSQTLTFLWSVVTSGSPANFVLPSNPDGSVDIDWSAYAAGNWDVNIRANDGMATTAGTLLMVTKVDNDPPTVGSVTGTTPVTHTDLAVDYSVPINDPEGDTLTVFWSVVPHGSPAVFNIPGTPIDPLTVDWSDYPALGDYDINVQVDDPFNPPVVGTLLVVTIANTVPTVGAVTGPTPVDGTDNAANYDAAVTDPDTLQTHTILWSVVPFGNAPSYVIPALGDGSVNINWSGYAVNTYDVNVSVDDGSGPVYGTLLTVTRVNTAPQIGAISGPLTVDCADTNVAYSSVITDADTTQSLTILWSLVPFGSPANFVIPDGGSGSIIVDWSTFTVGQYEINVRVGDGFTTVDGTPIVITKANTPPVVGSVTGPVTSYDTEAFDYMLDPATTDCDPGQTFSYWWSIVPMGNPADYVNSTPGPTINIDWSVYGIGQWTVGCMVDDGIDSSFATPLNVVVSLEPCVGSAHSWMGEIYPNKYSIVGAMSVLPRADITFLEGGISLYNGLGVAQTGPHTIGLFDADSTGAKTVTNIYNLGAPEAVVSLDTDPIEGRILAVTSANPSQVKVIDSSVILGNPFLTPVDTGDPLVTFVAIDVEEDGDFWAVMRDTTAGTVFTLARYEFIAYNPGSPVDPVYAYDPIGTLDITAQVGTNTDIFDIAINRDLNMLYLLEAGPIGQGTLQTYHIMDGFQAAFMGTLGDALFSQPLSFESLPGIGFSAYADIDVDHADVYWERCRILLYGRLADQTSELIRMDGAYTVLDTTSYIDAWPAFAINPDADPFTRNLIMPDINSVEYWASPVDW